MKKFIALLLVVMLCAVAVVTLCACNFDDDKIEIVFYHTMGSDLRAVLQKHIVEFNKIYPGIKITETQVGSYNDVRDQTKQEIQVGKGPNIAYCYPDHVALYNVAKAVATLDEYIDSTATVPEGKFGNTAEMPIALTAAEKDDFIAGYYNEGKQFGDGKMYTMPFSKSTEVMYYNKTVFEANNIPVPTHWWCTDSCAANCNSSMEKVLLKIREIDPLCTPLGYDSESNWFITMCEQLGTPYTSATGDNFLFNNSQNYEFVKKFASWMEQNLVTTQTIYGTYTSGLFTADVEKATEKVNKSYISIGSSAGANHQGPKEVNGKYPFEVGIATIPQASTTNRKVISQGPSVCILNKANKDEVLASWLFVKYLTTSVEFQAEFGLKSGYVPVLKSVKNNAAYSAALASADGNANLTALSAKVCLEQQDAYYTSPAFNGSSEARDQVGNLLVKCLKARIGDNPIELTDALLNEYFQAAVDACNYSIGK